MLLRALSRRVTRPVSYAVFAAWMACMALLVHRSYLQASSVTLAADLARYGTEAQWRGVYYRGEKIGFTVSQVVPVDGGYELQEDGRLQMSLLGATIPAILKTTARVDAAFRLQSFEFSLDPGTGPLTVSGRVDGGRSGGYVPHRGGPALRLTVAITTVDGTRIEERELAEAPALMLNLPRRLASEGLREGARYEWAVFDPATLRNEPIQIAVGRRELAPGSSRQMRPIPAFRVELAFAGLTTTAWVTDTGEVVREESPMGLISVREPEEQAVALAVSSRMQTDMLQASAVVPAMTGRARLDDGRSVKRLRLQVQHADLSSPDLQGAGQRVSGDVIELTDPRDLPMEPREGDLARYLAPEPFVESDAPEIREAAERLVRGATGARAQAERLTREVNFLLDKKPTVSLPSAREVLRTKVGDCNEHTVLYVAMARALGIPARINAGLVFVHGAFYYHAWPEVYLEDGRGRGQWLPVDPTLNQFPADATHIRFARGGLDQQARLVPLIGRLRIRVLAVELEPNSTPVLVGPTAADARPLAIPLPRRQECGCWTAPCGTRRAPVGGMPGAGQGR